MPKLVTIDVGPAIVVVVADGYAKAPAIVGDAGLGGDVGEGSVVIVVKQRGVWCGCFADERVEGRAVDEVDVEPAIVVVVEQGTPEPLVSRMKFSPASHHVFPVTQSVYDYILIDDGKYLQILLRLYFFFFFLFYFFFIFFFYIFFFFIFFILFY